MRQPAQCGMSQQTWSARVGKLLMKRNEQLLSNTVTNHTIITNFKIIKIATESPEVSLCLTEEINITKHISNKFCTSNCIVDHSLPNLTAKIKNGMTMHIIHIF
jgi:hypothetical protein